MSTPLARFVRGLLVFWSLWFTLVLATNALDALERLGLLSTPFDSGNYDFVLATTSLPPLAAALLFAGVIAWEALAAALFWRAALAPDLPGRALAAFAAGMGLFAGFLLADEVFVAYSLEHTHTGIFTALGVSLGLVLWLPRAELSP